MPQMVFHSPDYGKQCIQCRRKPIWMVELEAPIKSKQAQEAQIREF